MRWIGHLNRFMEEGYAHGLIRQPDPPEGMSIAERDAYWAAYGRGFRHSRTIIGIRRIDRRGGAETG